MNAIIYHNQNSYLYKNPQSLDIDWREKEFTNPNATIKLATMFSGIGAIEFALKRAKLKTDIIFASDNDKFVKQSYFANYNIDNEHWYNDVHDIDGEKYQSYFG